jgi:hypothetical protein
MESATKDPVSIFDTIEERSEHPEMFQWRMSAGYLQLADEERLFEGELTSIQGKEQKLVVRKYALTLQALIRFKASSSTHPRKRTPGLRRQWLA